MPEFLVCWEVDIDAAFPEEAALRAREMQLNPESIATRYVVTEPNGDQTIVDLHEGTIEEHPRRDIPSW